MVVVEVGAAMSTRERLPCTAGSFELLIFIRETPLPLTLREWFTNGLSVNWKSFLGSFSGNLLLCVFLGLSMPCPLKKMSEKPFFPPLSVNPGQKKNKLQRFFFIII